MGLGFNLNMEIIHLTKENLKEAAEKAARVMKAGGIVVYPTDTVYGLGVDVFNREAVANVRNLKGREHKRPISIIVPDIKSMDKCGTLNEAAKILAAKFLPGPLTLVLKAKPSVPEDITFNGGIGIRIPKHDFCLALAKAFGKPFTTTSANISGLSTPKDIPELMWHFGPKVAEIGLIVDAGKLESETPSTVVSCLEEKPKIIREGAIGKDALDI